MLSNVFYVDRASSPPNCSVTTTFISGTGKQATILEVLNSTDSDEKFVLARATVVSLLNAYQLGTSYPIDVATIVAMFNATFNGTPYPVNGSVSWSRTQVIGYLQSLYPAG